MESREVIIQFALLVLKQVGHGPGLGIDFETGRFLRYGIPDFPLIGTVAGSPFNKFKGQVSTIDKLKSGGVKWRKRGRGGIGDGPAPAD